MLTVITLLIGASSLVCVEVDAQDRVNLGPAQAPLYRAAIEAREQGDHEKALEILKGLLALGDLDIGHLEASLNHIELGQCDEAEASLEKALLSDRSKVMTSQEVEAKISAMKKDLQLNCGGKANAQQLYELGLDYFENREWLKAAQAFELALASDENATLAHNTGRSYEYAGNLDKAHRYYLLALKLAPNDGLKDRFERNIERLENLRGQMTSNETMASLLEISSQPSGAIVRLDGVALGQTPFQQAAAPGTYAVSVELEGYTTKTQSISLEPGREVVLNMELEPEGRVWTWISLSTSIAFAAGGVTLGVLAKQDLDEVTSVEGKRSADFDDIQARGRFLSNLSLGLFVTSALTAIATGVFFVYEDPTKNMEAGTARTLEVIIGPDFVGVGGVF
jgi:tetratricopeptide (TPR) repeat protein